MPPRNPKRVAVLGCGPAGLLVAQAVLQYGFIPHIISKKVKSEIPGSQYFHEPIPHVTDVYPENVVQYIRLGTAEGYAEKVYGDPSAPCGWEHYAQTYPSWNVPKAYDMLWEKFEHSIDDQAVMGSAMLDQIILDHDLTISTIPQQQVCYEAGRHTFSGTPFWIKPLPLPPLDAGKDIVVYNGNPWDLWYRWSILGGRCSVEYPVPPEPGDQDFWIKGTKAGETNCTCWGERKFVRAGRWAEWRHGVLLHHAYRRAEAALREL